MGLKRVGGCRRGGDNLGFVETGGGVWMWGGRGRIGGGILVGKDGGVGE